MRHVAALFALGLVATPAGAGALDDCQRAAATTPEVSACLGQRLKNAEERLDALEARVAPAMRELDTLTGMRFEAQPAFRQSQRAFKLYRDKQCGWVKAAYASGNGADAARAACVVDLTEARAAQLAEQLPSPQP